MAILMRTLAATLACVLLLGTPAFSQTLSPLPKDWCTTLPPLDAELKAWVDSNAPELKGAAGREVTFGAALPVLEQAASGRMSALELFTADWVRDDCAFFISMETLRRLEEVFELYLLTPFSGSDTRGRPFHTTALVFGRGNLIQFYDVSNFQYRHPHFREIFAYEAVIREKTPARGLLEISGVRGPFGLPIQSLRIISAQTVEVQAGPFKVRRQLMAISRKTRPGIPSPPLPAASLPAPEAILRWMNAR